MKRFNDLTLTVADLIQELQTMDPETPVLFAFPSGDHWRRDICAEACDIDETQVRYSEYHRSWTPVDDDEEDDDGESVECRDAIVLTGRCGWG